MGLELLIVFILPLKPENHLVALGCGLAVDEAGAVEQFWCSLTLSPPKASHYAHFVACLF